MQQQRKKTSPKKITNLTIHNDVGMKFVTSNVESVQKSVSTNFKNAKDQMNKIQAEYTKIKWQSEASEAFKSKFNKLKQNIISSFENIESQFTKLMTQTKNDIEKNRKSKYSIIIIKHIVYVLSLAILNRLLEKNIYIIK